MEQVLQQHWATTHISDLIPPLSEPLTNAETTNVLSKTLAFVALYRLPRPFFKSQQNQERWDMIAADAQRRLEGMKREHETQQRGMLIRERESLRRHVLGRDDMRRPVTQLLRDMPFGEPTDSGSEVMNMVSYVYGKMIHAAKGVEHASAVVFVGHQDWATLNRWEKINLPLPVIANVPMTAELFQQSLRLPHTSHFNLCYQQVALTAKEYFEEKRGVAQFLQEVGLVRASSSRPSVHSLGHHIPSLTARQDRRTGISEMALRSKWGGDGRL